MLPIWAIWPDGTMCEFDDIETFLMAGKASNYYLISVYRFDENGRPKEWTTYGL